MRLWSTSWINGEPISARCAAGRATFSDNLIPHLAWSEVFAGTHCGTCTLNQRLIG